MLDFAGLEKLDLHDSNEVSGIFDGTKMVFETTGWKILDLLRSFFRYGFSLTRVGGWIDDYISRFDKIYELQDDNCSYLHPADLIVAADPDLSSMLNVTLREYMQKSHFSNEFISEVAGAATRVNYNQHPDVPAFVGKCLGVRLRTCAATTTED